MNDARSARRGRAGQRHAEQLLERRVEERTGELTALLEVSRNLNSTLTLQHLLDLILEQVLRVLAYHSASIVVARDDLLETVTSRSTMDATAFRSAVGYTTPLARALPIWQAMLRGEPFVIGDVHRADDPFAETWRAAAGSDFDASRSSVRAWLGVPLSARGAVFGCLTLTREAPDSFTVHEIELAVAFAGHAAVAIDNARLVDESKQRTRELTALIGVAESLASTLNLEPLLDVILDQIEVVAEYDGAMIVSHDGDGDRILRRRAPTTVEPGHDGSYRIGPVLAARVSEAFSRRESVIIDDFRGDELVAQEFRAETSIPVETSPLNYVRSWMTVPLALTDRVIGRIVLHHTRRAYYTLHHAELVTAIAAQAAAAIENARLYDQTEQRARELATLLEVSHSLSSTIELGPLIALILDQLKVVADYSGASIGVIEDDVFRFLESRGASAQQREAEMVGVRLPLARSPLVRATLHRHETIVIDDVRADEALARAFRAVVGEYLDSPAMRYVRAFQMVPLVYRDELVGLLTLSSDRPETLERDGLVVALTRHAAATSARHEIAVETALGEEPDVPVATKEALYRIAQGAMHNAVKYSHATRLDLRLASGSDCLTLEVRDDGVGFDAGHDFAGHLGLHSMRERMAGLGGTTAITSAPGEGTSVLATVPRARTPTSSVC